jgi:phosphoribosyl-ATP pyrophosphohydrolase
VAKSPKGRPTKPATKKKSGKKKRVATRGEVASPLPPPSGGSENAEVLDRLFSVVMQRRDADPAVSHSARLLSRGIAKVAQKFGEEAVECLIEAVAANREALVAESADVLYHLIVLWVASGVDAEQIWAELRRREGVSGIAEKASRVPLPLALGLGTKKIP